MMSNEGRTGEALESEIKALLQSARADTWVNRYNLEEPLWDADTDFYVYVRCAYVNEDILINFDDFTDFCHLICETDYDDKELLTHIGYGRRCHTLREETTPFKEWITQHGVAVFIQHLYDCGDNITASIIDDFMLGVIDDAIELLSIDSSSPKAPCPYLIAMANHFGED